MFMRFLIIAIFTGSVFLTSGKFVNETNAPRFYFVVLSLLITIAFGVESGGYIYQGGGALIYLLNPHATEDSWAPPGPVYIQPNGVSYYDNKPIQVTFHTHTGSHIFSDDDYYGMMACFPNCDLIILYNCNAYVYTFEYGIFIP